MVKTLIGLFLLVVVIGVVLWSSDTPVNPLWMQRTRWFYTAHEYYQLKKRDRKGRRKKYG